MFSFEEPSILKAYLVPELSVNSILTLIGLLLLVRGGSLVKKATFGLWSFNW